MSCQVLDAGLYCPEVGAATYISRGSGLKKSGSGGHLCNCPYMPGVSCICGVDAIKPIDLVYF